MNGVSFLTMQNNNTNAIPNKLARALQHWACYICDVMRSQILNEGSIKYAISEYLEVAKIQKPLNTNSIAPTISEYKFESTHPVFISRTIDLKINYTNQDKNYESYYEFKYARERNISKAESARYIDDIFRLATLVMNNHSYEAYFLLVGPKQLVESLFSVGNNVATIQYPQIRKKGDIEAYKDNVQRMLSLDKEHPTRTFRPSDLKPYDEKEQIVRFTEDYGKIRVATPPYIVIQSTTEITTELIHSNSETASHDDIIVTVWRILDVKT